MLLSLFKPRSRDTRSVRLQDGTTFDVAAGETLLDAALRSGLRAPYNCRVGACKTCRCQLVTGSARSLVDRSYVLQRQDIRDGVFLACQTQPTSDLVLHWNMVQTDAPVHTATIVARRQMAARIWRLSMSVAGAFQAVPGQHVGVSAAPPGGRPLERQFSLVTVDPAPAHTRLEIDVARQPGGQLSVWMTRDDAVGSAVQLTGPFGDCVAGERSGPLIAIGAGSGIGAATGVLAHSHLRSPLRATMLLAYGSTVHDLYGLDELARSARHAKASHRSMAWAQDGAMAMPIVSRGRAPDGLASALREHGAWPGAANGPHLDTQVLLYGPPGFVDSCLAELALCQVPARHIRFDRYPPFTETPSPAFAGSSTGA